MTQARDADEADVVIVGGGPAGMCAAIRIKQQLAAAGKPSDALRVVVLEKAAEVGNHILSGAVIDPKYLTELIPDWKAQGAPLRVPVTHDSFFWLTEQHSIPLPIVPSMNNHGNYIASLGELTRWLGQRAEALGVEIFPGFAASELLRDPKTGAVVGVATGDSGISKSGALKSTFARGMELRARATLLAEGCRGSLTQAAEKAFDLGRVRTQPQTYGIGLKEVWRVQPDRHRQGSVMHTTGWPSALPDYAGSFLYHWDQNHVMIGYVIGLDYTNPHLNPYREFQKFKHHPRIAAVLEGGECVAYGARALNEGGFQAIPMTHFPGGAIVGCAAGFLNLPKVKGSHNAMKTGMLAADAVVERLLESDAAGRDTPIVLDNYRAALEDSEVWRELKKVRNIRPMFNTPLGKIGGVLYAGVDEFIFKGREPWTFNVKHADHETLKPAAECTPPVYPKPDGKISFDLLTNLTRAATNHEADQPPHLRVQDATIPVEVNLKIYDGPEQRYCPAGVYEYVDDADNKGAKKLQINASNCIHCKTCSIKDVRQNIRWTTPEGGGGPSYGTM